MEAKQETIDAILNAVKDEVKDFVNTESEIKCPIEYELRLLEVGMRVAKALMTETHGKIPKSRNLKKKLSPLLVK